MTTLTLTQKISKQRSHSLHIPFINWKMIYVLGMVFFLSMLVFYIFEINQLTQGTYLIKNYNKEISSLSKENRELEVDFAESGFLGKVTDKVKQLSFEKTTQVKYVQILETSLGMAK